MVNFVCIRITGLLTVLMLVACQTGPIDPETSTYYNTPVGSTLSVHTPLSIPPGTATIHIQAGEVRAYRDINRYYPHCSLEVKTLVQDSDQVVQPDVFTIQRSYFDELIGAARSPFMQARRISDVDGGPTYIEMQRVMFLHSDRQPEVLRMICRHWAVGPMYDQMTIAEMRQTLGKLISLQLLSKTI